MKTILVTGGTGFLGSNLCVRLIGDGNRVICIDNNYTGRPDNVSEIADNPNFKFILHDIANPLEIDEQIDQIYNLACPASPPAYQGEHSIETTKACVVGVINMLELARRHDARILQASTSEVYGEALEHPQAETYRGNVNPIGVRACYDEGKRCAESLFFDYWRNYGIEIKVVRIFNSYGPKMNPDDGRVISNFIAQALQGKDMTIYGTGTQTRSFCFVDDTINGLIRMMDSRADFTGPVNIGNPAEFTVAQVAEKIMGKIKSESKIVGMPLPQDDPAKRCPDITLARTELNWAPQISFDQGLDRTISHFRRLIN
ncbi:MAG: SDR family oxidoreductase [Rickettsiales bacterium]|jgi:UDP-glucuronate decarboxylase|nr:SDR family oxidoreductase [Rickettsiales bacterium]